jgi:hypothetical protein
MVEQKIATLENADNKSQEDEKRLTLMYSRLATFEKRLSGFENDKRNLIAKESAPQTQGM